MFYKIIIIEDELFVAMHLQKIISSLGHKVVQTYHSVEDFLEETDWKFDIAFVDIFLAGNLTGIDAAKVLKKNQKNFIFLTANQDANTILEAAKLGPSAYISKPFQAAEIEAALIILSLKTNFIATEPYYLFLTDNEHTSAPLTLREVDVLKSLLQGSSNLIIAEKLFISNNTVKTHLRNLFKKFDVNGKVDLIKKIEQVFA